MNMNRSMLIKIFGFTGLAALFIAAPPIVSNIYWISVLILTQIYILMAASMRTILLIGHISLGHIGFMLLGAYGSALLVMKAGFPFCMALIVAGFLSGLLGLALGYPFLRVRGIYFAILTLLTSESFRLVAFNWRGMTGGAMGLMGIPSPDAISIPGLGVIDFSTTEGYYYLTLVVICLSLMVLYRLERSRLGFKWRAIREAEKLAQAVGVNVMWYKLACFAVACFFAGIAGALFAHFQRGLSADASSIFSVLTSIYLLVYIVVGGENKFAGPIIGAFVLSMTSEFARPLEEFQPMMIGGLAIVVVMLMPGGILGFLGQIRFWWSKVLKQETRQGIKG